MDRRRFPPIFAALLIGSLLPGCATRPAAPATHHLRTELFLGTLKTNGSNISSSEFQHFINTEVTPRFPDGFTLVNAQGWWRSPGGTTTRENSKILLILHTPADNQRIQAIRDRYKMRFQQESVLEVTLPVKASF